MKDVDFIDASGIHELESVYDDFEKIQIQLFMCHLNEQPLKALQSHSHFVSKDDAIQKGIIEIIQCIRRA